MHPRKLEVRFSDPGRIYASVKNCVSHTLLKELQSKLRERFQSSDQAFIPAPVPRSSAPVGSQMLQRTWPAQKPGNIQQSLDFTRQLLSSSHKGAEEYLELGNAIQIFATYIIIAKADKILLIDQHAADERINFEKLTKQLDGAGSLATQALLIPETISVTAAQVELIRENRKLLTKIGFKIGSIIAVQLTIEEIPALLAQSDLKTAFLEILQDLSASDSKESQRWSAIKNKIIATMACHGSIRAGKSLTSAEISKLVADLFLCQLPYSCPHGRPVIWEISRLEIEKQFKRKL